MDSRRWRLAVEFSNIAVWEHAEDSYGGYVSDEWFLMRGLTPNADNVNPYSNEAWLSKVHPDDRDKMRLSIKEIVSGERQGLSLEYRQLHENGNYVWILTRGRAIEWSDDGTPLRFLGTDTEITQLKESEMALSELREEQVRFQVAVESAELGLWDVNWVTGERFYSDHWKRMRGYPPHSDYQKHDENWQKDVHPDDLEKFKRRTGDKRSIRQRSEINDEYRQRRADGSWISILSRGRVVERNADGAVARAIGIDLDVTEMKQREAEFVQLSKTLEVAISASKMGVWESSADSGDAIWDQRTCEIFGVPSDAGPISPSLFSSFIHPADRDFVKENCDIPAQAGKDFVAQFRILHPELGVRHIQTAARYNNDSAANARHVGVVFDATEQVEREAALQNTNRLLQGIADHMGQGIALFVGRDLRDFSATFVNNKFYDLLELQPPETSQNTTLSEFIAHVSPYLQFNTGQFETVDALVTAIIEGHSFNILLVLPSGRSISTTGTKHSSDARILTFTDMTDLLEAQQRSAELANNLSHLEGLQAVGKLTGGIAHDFNNLLSVILGNVELALESPRKLRPQLNSIRDTALRGAELTQGLLAFARKQQLRPAAVNIHTLFLDLNVLLTRTLGETINLTFETPEDIWNAHVDRRQLEVALINLAVNARDAMPEGGSLKIHASNAPAEPKEKHAPSVNAPRDFVRISVTDDGVGMSPEVQKKAIDPFYTTKDVGKGTGLGLSMVYGFIDQSDGNILIDSVEGQGTTITLFVPCSQDAEPLTQAQAQSDVQKGTGELIALVEDDPAVRQMTELILISLGYTCTSYENARSASDAILSGSIEPAVVLTDLALPGGMSGFDLGLKIKSSKPDLPVIYMSGYAEDSIPLDYQKSKLSKFIQKPFKVPDLAIEITNAIHK